MEQHLCDVVATGASFCDKRRVKRNLVSQVTLWLSDSNLVFAHETGAGLEMVHEGLVLKLAVEATRVANTVPRFDADEGSVLVVWTPECDDGCAEVDGDLGFTVRP